MSTKSLEERIEQLERALAQAQMDICQSCCTHEEDYGPHCQACIDARAALEKRQ